jgi:hypothetical protein
MFLDAHGFTRATLAHSQRDEAPSAAIAEPADDAAICDEALLDAFAPTAAPRS